MAVPPGNPHEPPQELKHDAVPGYRRAFVIAFAATGLYLLIILATSPGPAEKHHDHPPHQGHGEKHSDSPAHEDKPAH